MQPTDRRALTGVRQCGNPSRHIGGCSADEHECRRWPAPPDMRPNVGKQKLDGVAVRVRERRADEDHTLRVEREVRIGLEVLHIDTVWHHDRARAWGDGNQTLRIEWRHHQIRGEARAQRPLHPFDERRLMSDVPSHRRRRALRTPLERVRFDVMMRARRRPVGKLVHPAMQIDAVDVNQRRLCARECVPEPSAKVAAVVLKVEVRPRGDDAAQVVPHPAGPGVLRWNGRRRPGFDRRLLERGARVLARCRIALMAQPREHHHGDIELQTQLSEHVVRSARSPRVRGIRQKVREKENCRSAGHGESPKGSAADARVSGADEARLRPARDRGKYRVPWSRGRA